MDISDWLFVVVIFDALAQASDIRIDRRQVVTICWMQIRSWEVSDTNSPANHDLNFDMMDISEWLLADLADILVL